MIGQQFVGTFHTHPYASGLMGMAFSGEDFASALAHRENLSILHCGDKIVALVRTELTPKRFEDEPIDDEARELVRRNRRVLSLSDVVLKMNVIFCHGAASVRQLARPQEKRLLCARPDAILARPRS